MISASFFAPYVLAAALEYVDTVGRNKKAIEEYIKNQLQEDIARDQLSMKEYVDPFTGEPVGKGK